MDPAAIKRSIKADKKAAVSRLSGKQAAKAQKGEKAPPKAVPSPEELAKVRAEAQQRRIKHEADHMGNFVRVYPSDNPAMQARYAACLAAAQQCFLQHAAKRMRNTLDNMASKQRASQVSRCDPES